MLLTASILPHVIDSFVGKTKKIFVGLVVVLFLINFISSVIPFGHRTQDEMDVGLWLKQHYPHQTIFTDTKRILFYASSAPDYRQGDAHEMWLHGILGVGELWLREHDSWCQYDLLVLSAPPGNTQGERELFGRLQRQGVLSPILQVFKRQSNGEDILIASISHTACEAFVHKSIKNS